MATSHDTKLIVYSLEFQQSGSVKEHIFLPGINAFLPSHSCFRATHIKYRVSVLLLRHWQSISSNSCIRFNDPCLSTVIRDPTSTPPISAQFRDRMMGAPRSHLRAISFQPFQTTFQTGPEFVLKKQSHDPHGLVRASKKWTKHKPSPSHLTFEAGQVVRLFLRKAHSDGELDFGDLQVMMDHIDSLFFAKKLKGRVFLVSDNGWEYNPAYNNFLGMCSPNPSGPIEIWIRPHQTNINLVHTLIHEMAHAYLMEYSCFCGECNSISALHLGRTGHGKAWQELMEFMVEEVRTWNPALSSLPCPTHQYDIGLRAVIVRVCIFLFSCVLVRYCLGLLMLGRRSEPTNWKGQLIEY